MNHARNLPNIFKRLCETPNMPAPPSQECEISFSSSVLKFNEPPPVSPPSEKVWKHLGKIVFFSPPFVNKAEIQHRPQNVYFPFTKHKRLS